MDEIIEELENIEFVLEFIHKNKYEADKLKRIIIKLRENEY
jgi:hypothetical protein